MKCTKQKDLLGWWRQQSRSSISGAPRARSVMLHRTVAAVWGYMKQLVTNTVGSLAATWPSMALARQTHARPRPHTARPRLYFPPRARHRAPAIAQAPPYISNHHPGPLVSPDPRPCVIPSPVRDKNQLQSPQRTCSARANTLRGARYFLKASFPTRPAEPAGSPG